MRRGWWRCDTRVGRVPFSRLRVEINWQPCNGDKPRYFKSKALNHLTLTKWFLCRNLISPSPRHCQNIKWKYLIWAKSLIYPLRMKHPNLTLEMCRCNMVCINIYNAAVILAITIAAMGEDLQCKTSKTCYYTHTNRINLQNESCHLKTVIYDHYIILFI